MLHGLVSSFFHCSVVLLSIHRGVHLYIFCDSLFISFQRIYLFIHCLFIYLIFWSHWVFAAVHELSLVSISRATLHWSWASHCRGFLLVAAPRL